MKYFQGEGLWFRLFLYLCKQKEGSHKVLRIVKQKLFFVLFALWCAAAVSAQTSARDHHRGLMRMVYAVKNYIDSSAVRGIDPSYIRVPERPWHVVARSNVSQSILRMHSTVDAEAFFSNVKGNFLWEPRITTEPSFSVGVWGGYRGYGIGYQSNVAGDKGSTLSLGATGGNYGLNVRFHRFQTDNPKVHYEGDFIQDDGQIVHECETFQRELLSPIRVHTLIADGYYLLNGRHFSYSAAYDQSAIQLRSAGSLMVGAMYYYSHVNYADDQNADFILLMNNIGHVRQWQAGVGLGYAYNWVPARGWLVSAAFMPLVTFINRLKVTAYDSNYRQLAIDDIDHDDDELPESEYRISEMAEYRRNSNLTLNSDTRLSVTYQRERWYLNAYGCYNHFRYSADNSHGQLHDWLACLQLGIRF